MLDSQLASPKFTVSGTPIPLDPGGNEMCLLFTKYGRCRYHKKCTKSHWVPPLPDEELPPLPPLPSSPPPSTSTDLHGTGPVLGTRSEEVCAVGAVIHEQGGHNGPCCAVVDLQCNHTNREHTITVELKSTEPSELCHKNRPVFETLLRDSDRGHAKMECGVSEDNNVSVDNNLICQGILNPISGLQKDFVAISKTASCEDDHITRRFVSGGQVEDPASNGCNNADVRSPNLQCLQQPVSKPPEHGQFSLDLLLQKAYHGKCRFSKIFWPSLREIDAALTYKSGVTEQYKKMEAYFNRCTGKLEAHKIPATKAGRKFFKLFRRIHWRTCQRLQESLSSPPTVYHLTVNLAGVNFNRLRPYIYLLIHKSLSFDVGQSWQPTAFSCLVSDTLITLFEHKHISPTQAEQKLHEWGMRPVRARQCVLHLWSIIAKSSLAKNGVAPEVLECERDVYCVKPSALDYAVACSLAVRHVKAQSAEDEQTFTRVSQSVKQGLKANRAAKARSGDQRHAKPVGTQTSRFNLVATRSYNSSETFAKKHSVDLKESLVLNPLIIQAQICSRDCDLDGVSAHGRQTCESMPFNIPEGLIASTPGFPRRRKRSRQFKGLGDEEKSCLATSFKKHIGKSAAQ